MDARDYRIEEMEAYIKNFRDAFMDRFGVVPTVNYVLDGRRVPRVTLESLEIIGNQLLWETLSKEEFPDGIKSKNRKREIVIIRQCVMKIGVDMGYNLTKIAIHLGFDHATVIHAKKTINNLLEVKNQAVHRILLQVEDGLKTKYGYDGNVQFNSTEGPESEPVLPTLQYETGC